MLALRERLELGHQFDGCVTAALVEDLQAERTDVPCTTRASDGSGRRSTQWRASIRLTIWVMVGWLQRSSSASRLTPMGPVWSS